MDSDGSLERCEPNAILDMLRLRYLGFRKYQCRKSLHVLGLETGLKEISEEVAKVNPDLVVRDENGEIYTVRYDAVNAMLLNEFLKEHSYVAEQESTMTR
jgi:hypothetical protein